MLMCMLERPGATTNGVGRSGGFAFLVRRPAHISRGAAIHRAPVDVVCWARTCRIHLILVHTALAHDPDHRKTIAPLTSQVKGCIASIGNVPWVAMRRPIDLAGVDLAGLRFAGEEVPAAPSLAAAEINVPEFSTMRPSFLIIVPVRRCSRAAPLPLTGPLACSSLAPARAAYVPFAQLMCCSRAMPLV